MEDDSDFDSGERPGQTAARSETLQTIQRLIALAGASPQSTRVASNSITLQQLQRLLSLSGGNNPWSQEDDDDDDYEEAEVYDSKKYFTSVTEPVQAGVEVLQGGEFGRLRNKLKSTNRGLNVARLIQNRTSRLTSIPKEDFASNLVPNTNGTAVASYPANIYTGQYSKDSSFYYTCAQDFRLHVYDTTLPPKRYRTGSRLDVGDPSGLQTTMNVKREIKAAHGRWTITDANLSPDNERIVYSSIANTAYMSTLSTATDSTPPQVPIPFADAPPYRSPWSSTEHFGIWSCRFSADGNEIVAGGSGMIFVYDLLANRRTVKIEAHADDVNSCCWADTSSGNVLVSASDDSFLKVWDRRSLGASAKPSGVLVGHTEGITYVSAKGDGRYVISNGKDQAMRLWDLRKMCSSEEFDTFKSKYYGLPNFDYRYPRYSRPRYMAHPKDCSVMTYRGHAVLRTLIRCHFSPAETTGSQYLYTGSYDGRIHIYSLDGTIVQVLDRSKTLPMTFDPSEVEYPTMSHEDDNICVRDVSWHSQEPVLMSAGWEGHYGGSAVARHEWKGLSKMSWSLEDWAEKQVLESTETRPRHQYRTRSQARREHSRLLPGAYLLDEDDDDDDFEE